MHGLETASMYETRHWHLPGYSSFGAVLQHIPQQNCGYPERINTKRNRPGHPSRSRVHSSADCLLPSIELRLLSNIHLNTDSMIQSIQLFIHLLVPPDRKKKGNYTTVLTVSLAFATGCSPQSLLNCFIWSLSSCLQHHPSLEGPAAVSPAFDAFCCMEF